MIAKLILEFGFLASPETILDESIKGLNNHYFVIDIS
jgi:hypothetical protein